MQILRISSERRARLLADGCLAINGRSQEVLQGLSFEESQFLVDLAEQSAQVRPEALQRRDELALRHEKTRLRVATADDESSAADTRTTKGVSRV